MRDSKTGPDGTKTSDQALNEEFAALFGAAGYTSSDDPHLGLGNTDWQSDDAGIRGPLALCLSGGGIRSATFSLGVLQGLCRRGLLAPFDYLSTVSGGGYIGSWLSRWLAGEEPEDPAVPARTMTEALTERPYSPTGDAGPLRRLRGFSNFMSPTLGVSGDIFTVATIFVRNLFFNWLFWIPFALATAMLPWLLIFLFSQLPHDFVGRVHPVAFGAYAVPVLMLAGWAAISAVILLSAPLMGEAWREWLSRWSARLAMVGAGWLALFVAFVYVPWGLIHMLDLSKMEQITGITLGGGAFAVVSGLAGFWSRYGEDLRKRAYGVADVLGTTIFNLMALLAILILTSAASIVTAVWLAFLAGDTGGLAASFPRTADFVTQPRALITLAVLLLLVALVPVFLGCNRFSLHALYGNRLTRAFLGTARCARHPDPTTDLDDGDNIALAALDPRVPRAGKGKGPFHILNTTLNLTRVKRSSLDWQERKAASFTASALHCGSDVTGYAPSANMGGEHGMTLARAMTISGAAVSPNMGYHSAPLMALLMSVFNLRLGWWVPHPRRCVDDGNRPSPEPSHGIYYTVLETFRGTAGDEDWLYLSDGGHFENLGLYEMVRRHCRLIVVVDGGCDGNFKFADLHNALRKISVDLSIPIDLPSVLPGQPGAGASRIATGDIRYSARDPRFADGKLIVLKPMLNGSEPPALLEFAQTSRRRGYTFPHHSTADQFFSETQFESYRQLGEITAEELADAGILPASEPQPGLKQRMRSAGSAIAGLGSTWEEADGSKERESARAAPQAALAGPRGVAEVLTTLSVGQMFTGVVASAGILTAVTTVTHRITTDTYKSARGVIGLPPDPNFVLGLSAEDRRLIDKGLKVEASDTLTRLTSLLAQINAIADRNPPQFRARVEYETGQLSAAIADLSARIAEMRPSTGSPGLTRADLAPIEQGLTNILQTVNRPHPPTDFTPVLNALNGYTRTLGDISGKLDRISGRIDAINPRTGARGQ